MMSWVIRLGIKTPTRIRPELAAVGPAMHGHPDRRGSSVWPFLPPDCVLWPRSAMTFPCAEVRFPHFSGHF
jgi:hypothetical protein